MEKYDIFVCGAGSAGFCAAVAAAAATAIQDKVDIKSISLDKLKCTIDKNGAIIPGKERYLVNDFRIFPCRKTNFCEY